jgi:UDPglucose 6-dehydrogenase
MKRIAIIGFGHVGNALFKLFPDAIIYDPNFSEYKDTQEIINKECGLAFICVWTGTNQDGSCDTSIVEASVKWLKTPLIVIKSTVSPGTTDRLRKRYQKRICMSPEYFGESSYWTPDFWSIENWPYLIVGGEEKDTTEVMDYLVPKLGPLKTYYKCSALEAEIIKYMENAYFALKVTFANEMYDITKTFGADWYKVWQGWALDPRVDKTSSAVFPNSRGFGGKCLPKDTLALVKAVQKKRYQPELLKQVLRSNAKIRKEKSPVD